MAVTKVVVMHRIHIQRWFLNCQNLFRDRSGLFCTLQCWSLKCVWKAVGATLRTVRPQDLERWRNRYVLPAKLPRVRIHARSLNLWAAWALCTTLRKNLRTNVCNLTTQGQEQGLSLRNWLSLRNCSIEEQVRATSSGEAPSPCSSRQCMQSYGANYKPTLLGLCAWTEDTYFLELKTEPHLT